MRDSKQSSWNKSRTQATLLILKIDYQYIHSLCCCTKALTAAVITQRTSSKLCTWSTTVSSAVRWVTMGCSATLRGFLPFFCAELLIVLVPEACFARGIVLGCYSRWRWGWEETQKWQDLTTGAVQVIVCERGWWDKKLIVLKDEKRGREEVTGRQELSMVNGGWDSRGLEEKRGRIRKERPPPA